MSMEMLTIITISGMWDKLARKIKDLTEKQYTYIVFLFLFEPCIIHN